MIMEKFLIRTAATKTRVGRTLVHLCVVLLAALLMPTLAQAQVSNNRSWVAPSGSDANSCTIGSPCATFSGAYAKTVAGGEINCLEPGDYSSVYIDKSISIICQAGTAGIGVSGTNGIVVNAGSSDIVYLSGLDIQELPPLPASAHPPGTPGENGVLIQSAKQVSIVNSIIRLFNTAGINASPSASGVHVEVIDSVIADNPGTGILFKPSGSVGVRAMVDRTRVVGNGGDGIMANGTLTSSSIKVSVRDSESAHNAQAGYVTFSSGAASELMIDSSSASDNSKGIAANGSGAIARVTRSSVTANTTGVLQVSSGVVASYGTNSIDGNATDGTPGTVAQK
jgi:hypothetical protein